MQVGKIISKDFYSSGNTVLKYFSQPWNWEQNNIIILGGITALTAGSMAMDEPIRDEMNSWSKNNTLPIFKFGRWAGHGKHIIILAGGVYGTGLFTREPEIRLIGRNLLAAFFTAGLTTSMVKTLAGRARPYAEKGPYYYSAPGFKNKQQSFPSGHSTIGWLTAGVLAKSINNFAIKAICYSTAGVISLSRIYHDKHWFSDVVLGGVIGYTAADFIVIKNEDRLNHEEKAALNLQFIPLWNGLFVQVSF